MTEPRKDAAGPSLSQTLEALYYAVVAIAGVLTGIALA